MCFRQRPTENGKILGKHVNETTVDRTVTRHYPVSVDQLFLHPEIGAAMRYELTDLFKRTFIHEILDSFSRCQLLLPVLFVYSVLTPSELRFGQPVQQVFLSVFHEQVFNFLRSSR